ncbi:unnamed protein product [Orchesella dallaii]|uniref:Uncharacterized protein n=1 Tax=Orchesella dallaii TaxID=48710 RepID=A0ABP1RMU8_9HEXA
MPRMVILSDTDDEISVQSTVNVNSLSDSDMESDQDEFPEKTVQRRRVPTGPVVRRTVVYQGKTLELKDVWIKLERCDARQRQEVALSGPAAIDQCRTHGIRKTVQIRLQRCDDNKLQKREKKGAVCPRTVEYQGKVVPMGNLSINLPKCDSSPAAFRQLKAGVRVADGQHETPWTSPKRRPSAAASRPRLLNLSFASSRFRTTKVFRPGK